ncbi:CHAD domain-containing protein [Proteiniclasticum sp. C24MP]|uniref:CHAD domain-containing protein n=1 Tax=Proteiniclasticum sp. C24MP TaxID=3374101 RepID=UPI003753F247
MKNTLIDQFQMDAKVIFLAQDLLLMKLRRNPDETELEEIIHDLRINIRKLISLLYFHKPLLKKKERKELISSLKMLLRNFGSLRAKHVYLKSSEKFSSQLTEEEKNLFYEMNEREMEKTRFFRGKEEKLDPIAFRVRYEETLKRFLGYGKQLFRNSTLVLDKDSETFIADRYQELMDHFSEMERKLDYDSEKEVHKLRVLAKNINYTLQMKDDLLGDLAMKRAEHLKRIQDTAGKIHDADVHLKIVSSFETTEEEEKLRTGFLNYISREREEYKHKLKRVVQH